MLIKISDPEAYWVKIILVFPNCTKQQELIQKSTLFENNDNLYFRLR